MHLGIALTPTCASTFQCPTPGVSRSETVISEAYVIHRSLERAR